MSENQAGCEVKITEQAAKEFTSMCEDENKLLENSYLRVGANSGGCSGWKYSLDFEDSVNFDDLTFKQYGVTLVVDKIILNDVIGDIEDFDFFEFKHDYGVEFVDEKNKKRLRRDMELKVINNKKIHHMNDIKNHLISEEI